MLLNEEIIDEIKKEFTGLKNNVKLIVFTQELNCQYCSENKRLAEEVSKISDKIQLEVYNFINDREKVEEYKIDKIPAIVVAGKEKDYGIRFYGIPAGYEFSSLIAAIKMVSSGESGLSNETKEKIKEIKKTVHIQVFITPTCPYCPGAVIMGHKLAFENEFITADMVEATEFPDLSDKYGVYAVPKIIINEEIQFEGALPEPLYIENVLKVNTDNK